MSTSRCHAVPVRLFSLADRGTIGRNGRSSCSGLQKPDTVCALCSAPLLAACYQPPVSHQQQCCKRLIKLTHMRIQMQTHKPESVHVHTLNPEFKDGRSQPEWRLGAETWPVWSCLPQHLRDTTNGAPATSPQHHGPKVYGVVQRTSTDRRQELMAREWTVDHLHDEMRYIREVSGQKQSGLHFIRLRKFRFLCW